MIIFCPANVQFTGVLAFLSLSSEEAKLFQQLGIYLESI